MEHVCELLTHIRRRAKVCENCDAHSPPYIYTRYFVARTHSSPVTKTVEITTQSHATTNTLRVEHYKMCVCRYVCVFEAFPLAKIRCLAWYGNVCVGVCLYLTARLKKNQFSPPWASLLSVLSRCVICVDTGWQTCCFCSMNTRYLNWKLYSKITHSQCSMQTRTLRA